MQISYENGMKTIEFYLNDLTEVARKEFIEALDGDNGNYDIIPFATLCIETQDNECPLGGDISNKCDACIYSGDYEFKDGECIEKSDDIENVEIIDLNKSAKN